MNELAQARIELSLLEKQERELVKTLRDVRHAAEAQKTKIEELVKLLPPPIDRLPNELFLWIINLAIDATCALIEFSHRDPHDWKIKALMMVSRHWRNIIWHSPKLWNTIVVAPSWNRSRLKAYVERSHPSPVDVEIYGWPSSAQISDLNGVLDVAALCADRWRNVSIYAVHNIYVVLRRIRHLMLPSLARISMKDAPAFLGGTDIFDPQFFAPGNSPLLEYLEIGGDFITLSGLPILTSIKEIHIHLPYSTPLVFLERLSSYPRLATLTLSGDVGTLELPRPNSIRLPFLDKLICNLPDANSLLHAIVAPRLSHFKYNWSYADGNTFANLGSKFSSVSHLVLNSIHLESTPEDICSAFPNVQHVELYSDCADIMFQSTLPSFTWQHLEYLSIEGGEYAEDFDGAKVYDETIDEDVPEFLEGLINWLQQRQNTGQSGLRIRLSFFNGDADWISTMHDALHGLCILGWAGSAFNVSVGLCGTSTTPWLVCDFFLQILLISGLMSCRTCHLYLLTSQLVSACHFWRATSRKAPPDTRNHPNLNRWEVLSHELILSVNVQACSNTLVLM